ncbi:MAG TPA: 30S ribosomal protein S12 methylthiotransferase RimO [Acidimicrobiia bacterium]|nr:30S ribosomal protein S12 methylthiotransferase RimO [Acidimicrobiia bacterium]
MASSELHREASSRAGQRFWIETLGCPKNAVDSDKVAASLLGDGLTAARTAADADLVVVNTCAFIEAARQESIDTVLALSDARKDGARLVVTGCLAERYGGELAEALPEADAVIGFAGEGSISEVVLRRPPKGGPRDLLELPRPAPAAPWAYVKVAEGCDRTCAFCAIPSFRGKQRSRSPESILGEARSLVAGGAREIVLVAQDLASYGRDVGASGALAPLLRSLDGLSGEGLARVRLLYLYPSQVRDPLIGTMLDLETAVPYFDLSLQHASEPLLKRMRRWGSGERFLSMIDDIRRREPDAAFRSSFIVGFPGETEEDHEELMGFLDAAALDWAGLFPFSPEEGTAAAGMGSAVVDDVVKERLGELSVLQDRITQAARDALVGTRVEVLVDGKEGGVPIGRTHREAPEIDGVVRFADDRGASPLSPGTVVTAEVVSAIGPDLVAVAA